MAKITEFCEEWNKGSDIKVTAFETAGEIYWAEIRFSEDDYACDEEDFANLEHQVEAKSGGTISMGSSYYDFNCGELSLGIYSNNTGHDAEKVIDTIKELLQDISSFRV